jgi:hypothetical protein
MMNDEQPAKEASENDADNEKEVEEQEESDEEFEGIPKFIATRTTKEGFTLVTNFWRHARCQNGRCGINRQHTHQIFDVEAGYHPNAAAIYVEFCKEEDCEYKDEVHAHQGNDDEVMELEIPKEVIQRVWGTPRASEASSLSLMNDGLPTTTPTVEERANKQYMSIDFECLDIACPLYAMNHYHSRNIDPDHPRWGFTPEQYQAMIDVELTCQDPHCMWKGQAHVHTSLIKTQNISSMDDGPIELWPYIDDRADARYLHREFSCTNIDCPVYFTEHHHLLNIDPDIPDWEVRPTHYQAMIDDGWTCENMECAWKSDLHVHYQGTKNE